MTRNHFLFPWNPLRPKLVDELFTDQRDALNAMGHSTSLCPDSFHTLERPLKAIPVGATVIYRGWMLNAADYSRLCDAVATVSASMITSLKDYLATHHLPNWYPAISDLTPETVVVPVTENLEDSLMRLGWDAFFIKDYVKSLKTSAGSIIRDPTEIKTLVQEMRKFRGEIEGGLCIRRVEAFEVDSERRYFVLRRRPFSPIDEQIPEIVHEVVKRIDSPFYSVDIVRRKDGILRVVELGDGQVSDLVGWSPNRFASIWNEI